jgi:hypothetical protein
MKFARSDTSFSRRFHPIEQMEGEDIRTKVLGGYVAAFAGAFLLSAFANRIALQLAGNFCYWLDAAVIGASAMLIYYGYQRREAARREVNHHVRNAMMVILYSEDTDAVEQERKRIDAVLRTWL